MTPPLLGIHWNLFDWQSFSTLATGLLAVIAAWSVGMRQTAISEQHTKILERQLILNNSEVRQALFEKRYKVYDVTRRFIKASYANSLNDDNTDLQIEFINHMWESKFLFNESVFKYLDDLYDKHIRMIDVSHEIKSEVSSDYSLKMDKLREKRALTVHFSRELNKLDEIFYEMKLGEIG